MFLGEPLGQTWLQVAELGLAFVLSALIGLECQSARKIGSDSFLMKFRRRLALVSQGESMPCNLFEPQR
jgi:hypothetical protein